MSKLQTMFPLFISNTDLSLWSECELKFFRSRCQMLRKSSFNIDLTAGGTFAAGIEQARKDYYNEGMTAENAVEAAFDFVLESLHEAEFQDDLKSPERMALAVRDYFDKFPLDSDEVVPVKLASGVHAVEHKFTIELPINHPELGVPLIFKGKLDMLGEYMGRNYIVDEKTCKAIPRNQADLLATSGQFLGYAWVARELGVETQGVLVRKVAIQKAGNKIEQFEIPITGYMIALWYSSFLQKLTQMVYNYLEVMKGRPFLETFQADFQSGCTAYFRPCAYQQGCTSKYGEQFIKSEFEQIAWDYEERKEVPIAEFRKMCGLSVD